jgi:hypothetical protein
MGALVEIVRVEVSSVAPAQRYGMVGVALIAAAVTYYGISWRLQPHQVPLAAPQIAMGMFVAGVGLCLARETVAASLKSSRAWSLLRRVLSAAPDETAASDHSPSTR